MKNLKHLLFTFLLLSFSFSAVAHTKLVATSPADKSTLSSAPEELKLVFSQPVKLMKVEVFTVQGNEVRLAFMLSPVSSETFSIPLSELADDEYSVQWVAMGADTHKLKGEFTFTLKATQDSD